MVDCTRFSEVYRHYDTGIYGLIHPVRQRVYVGATKRGFRQRWSGHRTKLESKTHEVPRLQQDWTLDGGQAFSFVVLQELPPLHRMALYEQFWMDGLEAAGLICYNRMPATELPLIPPSSVALEEDGAVYTPHELACYLRVSRRTVYRWIRCQMLSVVYAGETPYIHMTPGVLDAFLNRQHPPDPDTLC